MLEAEIQKRFNDEMQKIKQDDPFSGAKIQHLKHRKASNQEAVMQLKKKEKSSRKKHSVASSEDRLEEAHKNIKIKSIIDFDLQNSTSIKSLAVKKNTTIKITTRFTKGKMLMFSKVSLRSFVYDIIDVFCSPNEEVLELYAPIINYIIKCFVYLILTDKDSCSIKVLFVSNIKSTLQKVTPVNLYLK